MLGAARLGTLRLGQVTTTSPVIPAESVFVWSGSWENGETIIIDLEAKTMTIDGTNVLHQVSGEFFQLLVGENEIIYEDAESARTVAFTMTHRDRWV